MRNVSNRGLEKDLSLQLWFLVQFRTCAVVPPDGLRTPFENVPLDWLQTRKQQRVQVAATSAENITTFPRYLLGK